MSFTEIIFAPFLFITFFTFFLFRHHARAQIWVLLIASYIFYGWWNITFLWLIVISSLLDFAMGYLIFSATTPGKRKFYLTLSLTGNLGLLGYFKYANFFIASLGAGLKSVGLDPHWPVLDIVLPVGISFYTFQTMSYSLDIYRGQIKPEKSLLNFLFFVAAFPQLVAGPIVRAKEFLPQLHDNLFKRSDDSGLFYILYGLAKKILLADMLGYYIVDPVFQSPERYSSLELVLGTYAYAFQIFFDFSAYSDIAIGLGRIFGLTFPVNFRSPYLAGNPTEFWRRWHITLSTWLRDYLYIPLGGNRVGRYRHIFNLMMVMLLGGLWHGANWTFVIWGGLHGLYLVLYKIFGHESKDTQKKYNVAASLIFFQLVCFAWIFFRSGNLQTAGQFISGIAHFTLLSGNLPLWTVVGFLAVAVFIHHAVEPKIDDLGKLFTNIHWAPRALVIFSFFVLLSVIGQKGIAQQAFIYFQF